MAFVRIFRKTKKLQKCHFYEISARQKSAKSYNFYQISRQLFYESWYFPLVPGGGTTRNHGTFLQKSPRKVAEITALSISFPKEKLRKSRHFPSVFLRKSCGNHGNFLKKSRRKVTEIIKKNMVKILNVGKCRFM